MWYNGAGGDFLTHLLVVDDEVSILELIKNSLGKDGYLITACQNADDVDIKKLHFYDLILLDVMMPGTDGFEFCKQIRNMVDCPILFLTAKTLEEDILFGLGIGADDYITKPFSVEELLARIRVTQRRLAMIQSDENQESSVFINGQLKIDYTAGCTYLNGVELHLTPIEYKLLCLLSRNVGKVLTHTYITQQIWGSSLENDIASLRVFMATLRKKLEVSQNDIQYIQTHIGIGYRMLKIE